jgi:prepilin signal peptidase PulO-like enzyme (type II secretory pathway)
MSSSGQSAHRVAALARAEGVLLRRNRIALLTALARPVAMVYSLKAPGVLDVGGFRGAGAMLLVGLTVFALLAAVGSAVTRTVELAQVTTLPVLLFPLVFSGLLFLRPQPTQHGLTHPASHQH